MNYETGKTLYQIELEWTEDDQRHKVIYEWLMPKQ